MAIAAGLEKGFKPEQVAKKAKPSSRKGVSGGERVALCKIARK
jgi:hypothetical protein